MNQYRERKRPASFDRRGGSTKRRRAISTASVSDRPLHDEGTKAPRKSRLILCPSCGCSLRAFEAALRSQRSGITVVHVRKKVQV